MSLLEVAGLKKYYPAGGGLFSAPKFVKAVDDVSFTLEKGEILGLVGESGCGKSTLARVLMRLEDPTAGSIRLEGCEMTSLKGRALREKRGAFQMIFQDPYSSLNPRMSVFAILDEALKLHTSLDAEERALETARLLEMVGLESEYANRYPHEFSGGQRQRIGIARALAVKPEFVIADEPVSALDVSVQAAIVNLLEDIRAKTGTAFLFIAHDLAVVEHISSRIMVMYLGKIVEEGAAGELCEKPYHPYTKALLSSVPTISPSRGKRIVLEGDVPSPLDPPPGCRFHTRCPFASELCAKEEPVLRTIDTGRRVACHFAESL